MESGIYSSEDGKDVFIVFGGKINVCSIMDNNNKSFATVFQELDKKVEVGTHNPEEWNNDKPSIFLIFNKKEEIDVLIKHLNAIKERI